MNKTKPLWVQVLWSESSMFKDNELLSFTDFEIKALKAAIKVGYDKGYDKTKIKVLLSCGEEYECRLDLAPHDTHGFEHHAKRMIGWYEKNKEEEGHFAHMYSDCIEFLKKIEWAA